MKTRLLEYANAARVMLRAGLIPVPRIDRGIAALRAVRKYGALAGPVHALAALGTDAVAIVDDRGELTYADLEAQSNAVVRSWLVEGLTAGSVLGAMCRNHRGLVITMVAASKIGAKLVLLNTGFGAPQLADIAARERIRAFVYDEEFDSVVGELPDDMLRYLAWGSTGSGRTVHLDDLIARESGDRVPPPSAPGGFVLLTSGTTGLPKGAPRERTSPLAAAQFLDRIPLRRGRTMVMAAPAFHGTGLSQLALGLALGNTIVMARKFDPEVTVALIAEHRADILIVVPTMLQRMVDLGSRKLGLYDTATLSIIFAAGSALSPDLCARTTEAFGPVLYNLYGSTEVAVASVATPEDLACAPGTAGRPPVTCRVALFDDNGVRIDEPNAVGRIFVASGLSFSGYTDGRDKDRIDGMLSTGDVGHFDSNGLLFVDGRDDDMIVSGGENVYPLEVENLLADRADVLEAAVIGVEDPDFGQRLRAFVVGAPGSPHNPQALKSYVKENLARYKVPREVIFVDELPRNETGKLLRRALHDLG